MSKWQNILGRKVIALKVIYDIFCAAIALALAFLTRMALLYFEYPPNRLPADIGEIYLTFFREHVLIFVGLTIGSLVVLGFYRASTGTTKFWKPFKIIAGVSLGPIFWALLLYFTFEVPDRFIPRGVPLIAWVYLMALIAVPRIVKYAVLQQMVVQVHHHRRGKVQNVLVIGGAGYIGSVLCQELLARGFKVRIFDLFLFGEDSIKSIRDNPMVDIVPGDFRNVEAVVRAMGDMDPVLHLGGIVGDPACSLDDDFTIDINLAATQMLAEVCKVFKVERFVFASSCSVYGANPTETLDESSPLNPVSLYARTKIASEQVLMDLNDPGVFSPTILRIATLFGLSNRPRYDLFVNLAVAQAVTDGSFTVFGGEQWRPFVHVRDIARVITKILQSPLETVGGEIFNVGSEEQCMTIKSAAQRIKELVPGTILNVEKEQGDLRNYRVSFKKMERALKIRAETTLDEGVVEMRDALEGQSLIDYSDPNFSNLKSLERSLGLGEEYDSTLAPLVKPRQSPRQYLKEIANKKYA